MSTNIAISVNGEGEFTYAPSVKHVRPGESLTWTCAQGPFAVFFGDGTPFGNICYQGRKSNNNQWSVTTHPIGGSAHAGQFHYAVAVYAESGGVVHMDAGCPVIIVKIIED